jgi:hypothetical protein
MVAPLAGATRPVRVGGVLSARLAPAERCVYHNSDASCSPRPCRGCLPSPPRAEVRCIGVAYDAHARFLDHHGNKITVPAPVDPETPNAPWWYDWIATNAATVRRAGFTAILYPPVCKTQSGHFNTGDGYGVYDQYDIGSKNQIGAFGGFFRRR